MFKKLRNKLLIMDIVIISILLFVSFSAIYMIMYHNISQTTENTINNTIHSDPDYKPLMLNNEDRPLDRNENKPPDEPKKHSKEPLEKKDKAPGSDMTLHFVVHIDDSGNIKSTYKSENIKDNSYENYIDFILNNKSDVGVISYMNGHWKYKITAEKDGYAICFMDFTSEWYFLLNLGIILTIVWLVAVLAVFLISLYNANRAIKPVSDAYESQKRFIADVSHEIKTPLSSISANVDVLMSKSKSTIEQEEKWLNYIKNEVERMTKLTNDLLYLAKSDSNEINVEKNNVSLSNIVECCAVVMEAVIYEKSINLELNIEDNINIYACEEDIKQLIIILLDNAAKYTPENGQIFVVLKKIENYCELSVKNTGNGISKEDCSHIFERFYRTDKSRARTSGGFGLGLAIAKSICNRNNGNIEVKSKEGQYTEFIIKFKIF
ncbi:MAG: HAMP domain-containing sensor histidine kinase [Lachnospirales bacterium]